MELKTINKTIAVLPFKNLNQNEDDEYFCDGITEEIINNLARVEHLNVISRTSSFFFKNKDLPLNKIASQINAEIILEGSVRIESNNIRITARLIESKNDFCFWSKMWDRKIENILELQTEISLLIAEKLREDLGHFEIKENLIDLKTKNIDAFNYYLRARYYFNKWNPQDVKTSIKLFNKAVDIDPNFVDAFLGLADAYSFLATTQFMTPGEAWKKTVEYIHKAYNLNPDNAGVHYQLANLSFFTDCNFTDAYTHILKALKLKPSYPEAQQYIAFLNILSGDMERARYHLQFALGLDPLNQETLFYKGYYLYRSKKFDKALDVFDDLLKNNSKNIPAFVVHCYCLLHMKKFDELLRRIKNIPDDIVIPHEKLGILTLLNIMSKNSTEANKLLEKLIEEAKKTSAFQAHSYLFLSYANLGKFDDAFELLENAISMKSSVLLISFSDPLVNGITKDKRYNEYQKRLYGVKNKEIVCEKKKPLIDDNKSIELTNKVLNFVEVEKPYLNPNLSLRVLANLVEIHPNQLSWLLNEKIGKKFNDFINSYRIEYFKNLAKNPENLNISILGLAYESGFNSKTVFNTYFKKETGITPKQYLDSNS